MIAIGSGRRTIERGSMSDFLNTLLETCQNRQNARRSRTELPLIESGLLFKDIAELPISPVGDRQLNYAGAVAPFPPTLWTGS
jgi:hypothetical protein